MAFIHTTLRSDPLSFNDANPLQKIDAIRSNDGKASRSLNWNK